ncbi:MAG TPA: hypothetical protein VFH66_16270 [Mycobacteriales bacterium]|nr:hypothetical protein [Mycobacteriales bacterium]
MTLVLLDVPLVGQPLTFVGAALAHFRDDFALVGHPVALVGGAIPFALPVSDALRHTSTLPPPMAAVQVWRHPADSRALRERCLELFQYLPMVWVGHVDILDWPAHVKEVSS